MAEGKYHKRVREVEVQEPDQEISESDKQNGAGTDIECLVLDCQFNRKSSCKKKAIKVTLDGICSDRRKLAEHVQL